MKNHLRVVSNSDEVTSLQQQRQPSPARTGFRVLETPRYVIYVVLLFIRIPVQIICRLTVVPLLLFAMVWGVLKGWTSTPAMVMAGAAFGIFVCAFLYDRVLLRIAPESIHLPM